MDAVTTVNNVGSGSLAATNSLSSGPIGTIVYVVVGATLLLVFVGIVMKFAHKGR